MELSPDRVSQPQIIFKNELPYSPIGQPAGPKENQNLFMDRSPSVQDIRQKGMSSQAGSPENNNSYGRLSYSNKSPQDRRTDLSQKYQDPSHGPFAKFYKIEQTIS